MGWVPECPGPTASAGAGPLMGQFVWGLEGGTLFFSRRDKAQSGSACRPRSPRGGGEKREVRLGASAPLRLRP